MATDLDIEMDLDVDVDVDIAYAVEAQSVPDIETSLVSLRVV